jgi:hypothetical protein
MKRAELENKLTNAYDYANEQFKTHSGKLYDKHSNRIMHEELAKYYETNAKQISLLILQVTNDNIEEISKELDEIKKFIIDQTQF